MNIAFDISMLLNALVLAGILWLIRTVNALDKKQAVAAQSAGRHEKDIIELRAWVARIECDIAKIKIDAAKISARCPACQDGNSI